MNCELTKEQALGKAARLCSGSEHCSSQIREKLLSWGMSDEDAEDIIGYLIKEKYIDDTRFSRAYCHDKFCYSHWGRVKIRQMLRHLHLTDAQIAEGMETIPEEAYLQTIADAVRQKNRTLHDTDTYQRKVKLVRHLLSRGFEMELVIDAVDDCLKLG
ncbi:MAG: RecX family transcriptional regulator [Bacteroidaceae bacterium]|nr:RecX family transcriptional regulator [Bacteroidaceae bacterium]